MLLIVCITMASAQGKNISSKNYMFRRFDYFFPSLQGLEVLDVDMVVTVVVTAAVILTEEDIVAAILTEEDTAEGEEDSEDMGHISDKLDK